MNSVLSFKDYYGSFDYRLSLGITNEIPAQVKRDYNSLTGISERMTNLLRKTAKNWSSKALVENICEGISNCNYTDGNVRSLLSEIIKNNNKIIQLYQASVLEKPALKPLGEYVMVSDDFESEIETNYNRDTLTACSSCEWATLSNVTEKIQNISFKNSDYEQWVQAWKQAWKMLQGNKSNDNSDLQKQYLWEYLQWQWVNSQQSDIVLGNLDRYESWGLSSSNPAQNSADYSKTNIKEDSESFQQSLSEKFAWEESVSIVELSRVNTSVKNTSDVNQEIWAMYQDLIPNSFSQDTVTQEVQARLIRMHFSLIRSINLLEKNKWKSTQACEKAWPEWRCDYSR